MSEKRTFVITPKNLAFSIVNPDRDVIVALDLDPKQSGLLIDVAIRMSPNEARLVGATLIRKADEAEAGLPRA
jgi:hypothetical protein